MTSDSATRPSSAIARLLYRPSDAPTRPRFRVLGPTLGPIFAAVLLAGGFMGGVLLLPSNGNDKSAFVELYLTDLPADFSRVDVWIQSVSVGTASTPLTLEQPGFDLLAMRGPAGAQRIASGLVPADSEDSIRIVFQSVRAELDHKWIPLAMKETVLVVEHDYGIDAAASRSILFDIDLDQSIRIDGAHMEFVPTVASVFIHVPTPSTPVQTPTSPSPESNPDAARSAAPAKNDENASPFVNEKPETPKRQALEPAHKESAPRTTQTPATAGPTASSEATFEPRRGGTQPSESEPDAQANPSETDQDKAEPPVAETEAEGGEATEGPDPESFLPSQEGANSVPADYAQHIAGWLVQFVPEAGSPESMMETLQATGAEIVHRFESVPAAYILANSSEAQQIAQLGNVSYLEPDLEIDYLMASSTAAIRLPELLASTLRDPNGLPFDGQGVGIAVVDTGIDGMHPDLPHRLLEGDTAPVRANWKVESIALVDEPYTDTTSGHGTHVAGIIAGQGTKDASQRGVAPGAKLYGFGTGELSSLFWTNQALDWIVQHHDDPTTNPPIRVVTNSWGTQGPYDANSLTTQLVKKLVAEGIVVVFSAGNDAGTGNDDKTTAQCKIPLAGVICVAAYNDANTGNRDGAIASYSSRGQANQPSTWPDVSAPGSFIRSTRSPFGWVSGVGLLDYYLVMNGTSMAAPHVAGAAALMIQANPALTPTQVESILKSSAYEFAQGGAYDSTGGHYAKGHGLLDIEAAVNTARSL